MSCPHCHAVGVIDSNGICIYCRGDLREESNKPSLLLSIFFWGFLIVVLGAAFIGAIS